MTTKQKIMASIWVPVLSLLIISYLISIIFTGDFLESIINVFNFFSFGAIFWIPTLIICLFLENAQIKNEINNVAILKIFEIEALICSIPIWILMFIATPLIGILVIFNLIIILCIAARWGFLKWRKIC